MRADLHARLLCLRFEVQFVPGGAQERVRRRIEGLRELLPSEESALAVIFHHSQRESHV